VKPTICIDFDGVINSYESGYGPHYKVDLIPDGPIEGTKEAIEKLRKKFKVVVQSTRCADPDGKQAIVDWLEKYDIKVDEVVAVKPAAVMYIDDRAIQFRGNWTEALHLVAEFNHWLFGKSWDTTRYEKEKK
jgi:hypothetical protein